MQRIIVQPADLAGAALAELKQWLGITGTNEDALLSGLLSASLDLCESFTGQVPLETVREERLNLPTGWKRLVSLPVQAITSVEQIAAGGSRSVLPASDYEVDIEAAGSGCFRLTNPSSGGAFAVRLVAGIAPDWASLPDALRHGIIRLAAHNYRDRDAAEPLSPPASVAALWRPWRRLRLA